MLFFLELLYLFMIIPIEVHRWPILWPIYGYFVIANCDWSGSCGVKLNAVLQRSAVTIFASFPQPKYVRRVSMNSS